MLGLRAGSTPQHLTFSRLRMMAADEQVEKSIQRKITSLSEKRQEETTELSAAMAQ
jgi:hypothetical protein